MSEVILLGAGASKDAGLPLAVEMTSEIENLLQKKTAGAEENQWVDSRHLHVLRFCISALTFHDVCSGSSFQSPDIERVFNALEMLSNRTKLDVAPFVSLWHPAIESIGVAKATDIRSAASYLLHSIRDVTRDDPYSMRVGGASDDEISYREEIMLSRFQESLVPVIRQISQTMPTDWVFADMRNKMLRMLYHILWVTDPTKVEYFESVIKHCKNQSVPIVSLNYDNCIELCAEQLKIRVDTGFDGWSNNGSVGFDSGALHLAKVHGSIDWINDPVELRSRQHPVKTGIFRKAGADERGSTWKNPAVIFGGLNKLTATGPFLQLFQYFQDSLKKSNHLIVIGYSFRDDHINATICSWLNSTTENKVTVVNGSSFNLEQFCSLLGTGCEYLDTSRIAIIAMNARDGLTQLDKQGWKFDAA